tara:strand:- start:1978 stop:2325 length:348 start_codon:yes stop_codon:yes gene_type:complete
MSTKEIRDKFIELIGINNINYIESNNWINYGIKPHEIYNVNAIKIEFLEKDNLGDTVIHHHISYDLDECTWTSENCIDYADISHTSFSDMQEHIKSIEDEIIGNGFRNIDLPNVL